MTKWFPQFSAAIHIFLMLSRNIGIETGITGFGSSMIYFSIAQDFEASKTTSKYKLMAAFGEFPVIGAISDFDDLTLAYSVLTLMNHGSWFVSMHKQLIGLLYLFIFLLGWVWTVPFLLMVEYEIFKLHNRDVHDKSKSNSGLSFTLEIDTFRRRSFIELDLNGLTNPAKGNESASLSEAARKCSVLSILLQICSKQARKSSPTLRAVP